MNYLLPTFKTVNLIFATSAIITGLQSLIDPIGFSVFFGIPVKDIDKLKSNTTNAPTPILSYISLMGIRQLATGITLLVFSYQNKWTECATILSILGIVVAGTDGVFLYRSGARRQAGWHAVPGAGIALLAAAVVWVNV